MPVGRSAEISEEPTAPFLPAAVAQTQNRVRGQDTADLYHFFKQAQASTVSITTQVRLSASD